MTTEIVNTDNSEEKNLEKPVKEHRMKEIKIRLLEDEHAKLMELKIGKKLAPWIRKLALGVEPICVDSDLVLSIGRVGSNLNQIAKHANIHKKLMLRHWKKLNKFVSCYSKWLMSGVIRNDCEIFSTRRRQE